MTDEQGTSTVESLLKDFTGSDLETFMGLWSDDVVWRIGVRSQVSGVYRGKDEILAVCQRMLELGGGTLTLETVATLFDDRYGCVMVHATGERDGRRLDVLDANFVTVNREGRLDSCWWLPNDQKASDDFFA